MYSFHCNVLHIRDATQRRRLCNLSKADRSIDSLPETYESSVRILEQFYSGWKKDATAVQEKERGEKGRTQEAATTDTRKCRHSSCTPTRGISRNASRVEIACVEWKARKNNFVVLLTRFTPLMVFVFVAIYFCLLSKLLESYCHIFSKLHTIYLDTLVIPYKNN